MSSSYSNSSGYLSNDTSDTSLTLDGHGHGHEYNGHGVDTDTDTDTDGALSDSVCARLSFTSSDDDSSELILDSESDEELYIDEDELENEYDIDDIYREECDFLDTEKQDGHYYLGLCSYMPDNNLILYANAIEPRTFFKHVPSYVMSYLRVYSIFKIRNPTMDIMKLSILDDNTYTVLVKTYWLRIIQRTWKRVYKQRKDILNKRMNLNVRRLFEITGRYPPDISSMPSLKGMLLHMHEPRNCVDDYLFVEGH